MFRFHKRRQRLNLALQGGGAHGAFTWGVLDRLLEDSDIDIGWLSGTSAGAINAVALASGLAVDGRAGARATMRAIWEGVVAQNVPDLLRYNPFFNSSSRSGAMGHVTALFSPYQFNPLGLDPLRKLVSAHIDFERLKNFTPIELLIAATDVGTGRARLFRRAELTIDHVLASTCLPTLHHAVLIDGRATWDGGFAANPDLVTLAAESPVGDTLLVQLNPLEVGGVPRTVGQIAADMNRITFNQPLLRDVAEIVAVQKDRRRGWVPRRATRTDRVASHRFHVIEAGRHTAALPADSKLRPDRELIFGLHSAGREEAQHWLSMHRHAIGRASSVDLEARYLGPLLPGAGEATAEATAPDEPAPDARVATLGTSSN